MKNPFTRQDPAQPTFFEGVPPGAAAEVDGTVIVIGAGAAGLSAAQVLQQHGCDVVVLEGRDRLGGRLHTMSVGDGVVDEGANWIHGAPANPLYHLAVDAGFKVSEHDVLNPRRIETFDDVSGRRLGAVRMLYITARAGLIIDRFAKDSPTAPHPEANLAERVDRQVARIRGTTTRRRVRALIRTIVDMTAAKEAEHLDPNSLVLVPDEGGKDFVISGGFSVLIDRLAAGLDVRLGTSVESIRYCEDGVVVDTSGGIFQGSHVIVTVPLGVLKAQMIGFNPPLPSWKTSAIDNVGVGVVEKIVMTFESAFWRSKPERSRALFYISDVLGEFPAFVDSSDSAGCPMLVAFLTGVQAERLGQDPEPLIERAGEVLREVFPESYEPPAAVHVTRWGSDPFSLCSYATTTVGITADDFERLADPVEGRVLFAGEATFRERAGFVEGAMGSGIREARRVLGRDVDLTL